MDSKLPISCFIIAKNEADRISKTIESVIDIVDEVIVIDSGSTDGTQNLAKELGCKVFFNKWSGYGPQKRFGEDCTKNEWLLNLDADEYLSDEIKSEILQTFENNNDKYKEAVLSTSPERFIKKDNNNSKIFYLKNHIYHNSVRSFKHLIEKEKSYIQLQSKSITNKNKIFLLLRIFVEFPLAFIKYYIIRRHFTGALTGLITALILAYYRWKRVIALFKN